MKVLHIISSFELGGAERVAINIAKSRTADIQYFLVEVIKGHSSFSGELLREMEESGIKYFRSPILKRKLAILLFPFWFIHVYRTVKPDVIHCHTEVPDTAFFLFRLIMWPLGHSNVSVVRTIHNNNLWSKWDKLGKIVEHSYIKKNCNVAVSKSIQESYLKTYGDKNLKLIYNGIQECTQKPFSGVVEGKINVLFASRLEEYKGVATLIEIIKMEDSNIFHFSIIGSGSMSGLIRERLSGLSNVTIYDKIFQLSSFLSSFDYLLMPSWFEGLCLLSIEASFAKLPVIINSCPGLEETLPVDWPLKVSNNSLNEYRSIFNQISRIKDRSIFSKISYSYVKGIFDISVMQSTYEDYYRQAFCRKNLVI